MDEMEMGAAAEALEEIRSLLERYSMRKPQQDVEPAAEVSVEIEAAPEEEAYAEEEAPFDAESVVAEEVGEDAPISIMDFGSRQRKPQSRPSAPPPSAPPMQEAPMKRGRGRPKKVR